MEVRRPWRRPDSLIGIITSEPSLIPDGWEMVNNQCLVSPFGIWLVELESSIARPGSFTISDSDGTDEPLNVLVELRVSDPRAAIKTAVTVDAWWQEEMK